MNSKFALRTLPLLLAFLCLQNFNVWAGISTGDPEAGFMSGGKGNYSSCVHLPVCGGNDHLIFSPPQAGYKITRVVLDAGHGGKDPGCKGAISFEKDNNLAIILKLGALIEQHYPEIKVIYTRDTDVFIELNERANIANRNSADLFISVHCNAISAAKVSGTETYVLGVDRAAHNLEVAKRENAVITMEENYQQNYDGYDPASPEAHIFSSVYQSAYLEQSILFASLVQENAVALAERDDKGVKQAGFLVLRETAMPAVLVEAGYLTNRTEEAYIASEEGQVAMATAIFKAFEAYKDKMEGGAGTTAAVQTKAPRQTTHTATTPSPQPVAKKTEPSTSTAKAVAVSNPPKKSPAPASPASKTTGPQHYRILLITWPSRLDPNTGQLSLLSEIKEELKEGKYHYFTGDYTNRPEADKMLQEIRNLGFKTATVEPLVK